MKELKKNFQRPHISYGFVLSNDYVLSDFRPDEAKSLFKMTSDSESIEFTFNMLGKHNVLNAAAAAILCLQEGITIEVIQDSLHNFMGIDRRMQILGERKLNNHNCVYIDDYGHHPTEIEKTIEAIRSSFPGHNINMVFQPHRFTRTHDLYDDFIRVLAEVDELLLLDIYPAGEAAIEGINSLQIKQSLIDSGFNNVELIHDNETAMKRLDQNVHSDTVFIFQGAGNISSLSQAKKNELP